MVKLYCMKFSRNKNIKRTLLEFEIAKWNSFLFLSSNYYFYNKISIKYKNRKYIFILFQESLAIT